MCLNNDRKFHSDQIITGDVQGKQNGFRYKVLGADAKCSFGNTTWKQINMENGKERAIYRFDSSTPEFSIMKFMFGKEQSERKKSLFEAQLIGTQKEIDQTNDAILALFKDPNNHLATIDIGNKPLIQ